MRPAARRQPKASPSSLVSATSEPTAERTGAEPAEPIVACAAPRHCVGTDCNEFSSSSRCVEPALADLICYHLGTGCTRARSAHSRFVPVPTSFRSSHLPCPLPTSRLAALSSCRTHGCALVAAASAGVLAFLFCLPLSLLEAVATLKVQATSKSRRLLLPFLVLAALLSPAIAVDFDIADCAPYPYVDSGHANSGVPDDHYGTASEEDATNSIEWYRRAAARHAHPVSCGSALTLV